MRLASLPMYDRPELTDAHDELWAYLRRALLRAGVEDVPAALIRPEDHEAPWRDDRLLFSQTCGFDVRYPYRGRLIPVAAPAYAAAGCNGKSYSSSVVVRASSTVTTLEDLRGARAAFNQVTSHSGRVAFSVLVAPLSREGRFFSATIRTGSHQASAEAVARGDVDVAAVDCTSLALLERASPETAAGLRLLTRSAGCPAPPYVVGPAVSETERNVITAALLAAARDPALAEVRSQLLLTDIVPVSLDDYVTVDELVASSSRSGYDLIADRDRRDPGSD